MMAQPADLISSYFDIFNKGFAIAITELWVFHFELVCYVHGSIYARAKEFGRSQRH